MKTLEMIDCASLNPDTKYQCFIENVLSKEFWMSKSGYFYFSHFDSKGDKIPQSLGSGGFNGNLRPTDEWKAKHKTIDFMTAIKIYRDGKTIICESNETGIRTYKPSSELHYSLWDQLSSPVSAEEILSGKWYIED